MFHLHMLHYSSLTDLLTEALTEASLNYSSVLCLGLGSPTASREARAQLAFLLDICDRKPLVRRATASSCQSSS